MKPFTITKTDLKKINDYTWKIPNTFNSDMHVPAFIFTNESMLDEILQNRSLEQLVNITTLPGIQNAVYAMPSVYEGYGFPNGSIAATPYPDGVISPGGVGYDINCGVRALRSQISFEELKPFIKKLTRNLLKEIPKKVGHAESIKLGREKFDEILREGARCVIKEGYGEKIDTHYVESYGVLNNADPSVVSNYAKKKSHDQLGTIGSENHRVEIDKVDEIFDEWVAKELGLKLGQIIIVIHTGSRGLGHQITNDYLRLINQAMTHHGISMPGRELACVPLSSSEGRNYFNAMAAAANFAWANRQMITYEIRNAWKNLLGQAGGHLSIIYDNAHNIIKIEDFDNDKKTTHTGERKKVIIHRRGATRAFPPRHQELVSEYQRTGQPVIITSGIGNDSYIVVGTPKSKDSFYSICHNAGRKLSPHRAKKEIHGRQLKEDLEKKGINIETKSASDLAGEAPLAYKNIHDVVNIIDKVGLAKKAARLKPIVIIKE